MRITSVKSDNDTIDSTFSPKIAKYQFKNRDSFQERLARDALAYRHKVLMNKCNKNDIT